MHIASSMEEVYNKVSLDKWSEGTNRRINEKEIITME
jgi:hypothetical protein